MDIIKGLVNLINGVDGDECRFCRIASWKSDVEKDALLYEDEEIVVFQDHRAAARHHLLVVPKAHIRDCRVLHMEHLPLLDRLVEIGKSVMESRLTAEKAEPTWYTDVKMGFHYPPKISVPHLHLHVIAPYSNLKKSKSHKFLPENFWFVSPEFVKYEIEKQGGTPPTISPETARHYQQLEKWLRIVPFSDPYIKSQQSRKNGNS